MPLLFTKRSTAAIRSIGLLLLLPFFLFFVASIWYLHRNQAFYYENRELVRLEFLVSDADI